MRYERTWLQSTVLIQNIITMYYFELGKHYAFLGESHDFWELLYVDKGELEVWGDDRSYQIKQGTIVFHKPNEYHKFYAQNGKAPNIIVITFDCQSESMKRFENAVVRLDDEERNLLAKAIEEGMKVFAFPFTHPLVRRPEAPVGGEQMIKLYLESLFIHMLRRDDWYSDTKPLSSAAKEKEEDVLVTQTLSFLQEKMDQHVSLEELCDYLCVSKSHLKQTFKQKTGQTVMESFAQMKMERAKLFIREETYNFTEIASLLGFGSVHAFSKAFKRKTDMTPSEYARSIRGRVKDS